MGQFLAIGIVTEIGIEKNRVEKVKLDVNQLQEKMQKILHYVPELYTVSEDNEMYYFQLKEDVFYSQLIPLLKSIYPLLYDDSVYYDGIFEKLENMPPSQWLDWAKTKPEEPFQFDEYGSRDYLSVGFSDIVVYYDSVLISMEGKIMMETFGRQFRFLKYALSQAFKEFSLAGALRIYITG